MPCATRGLRGLEPLSAAEARCVWLFVWLVRTSQAWATGSSDYGRYTDRNSPTLLPSPTRVVQVAAGNSHTMLLGFE